MNLGTPSDYTTFAEFITFNKFPDSVLKLVRIVQLLEYTGVVEQVLQFYFLHLVEEAAYVYKKDLAEIDTYFKSIAVGKDDKSIVVHVKQLFCT